MLDQGPEPTADQPPGVLDDHDLVLFMAADAGERVGPRALPGPAPAAEIGVHDPLTGATRWAYLIRFAHSAPRSTVEYVDYDPAHDRVRSRRVGLGFSHGIPDYLAVADDTGELGANLLDRLKVRAQASFLWGLIRISRSEEDLTTQFVGWKRGPIRVIRRQRQRVRIGWGIRSPTFGSSTYFYRDYAELPVSLTLNVPPRYFFGDIDVRAILDFRDLRGWSLLTANLTEPLPLDGRMTAQKEALNKLPAPWFALLSPKVVLVQTMEVSPSLSSLRQRLIYHEAGKPHPPESVPGEEPGVGFELDRWDAVAAGTHQLASTSYALPPALPVRAFMQARSVPLQIRVGQIP